MGFLTKFVLATFVAFIAFAGYQVRELTKPVPAPKIALDEYWGPGKKEDYKEDVETMGNRVFFPEQVIKELAKDLNRTLEFHPPLEGVGFEYGFNTDYLQKIIKYWRDDYLPRWRERELYLWRYPHITTNIQGLQIHFLHTKFDTPPKGKKVFPLLLLHGWPGSIREFYDLMPLLLENEDSKYAFELVVPSLPGYGWSQSAAKPGLGATGMAVIFRNLMLRLGYKKFFIQGGDWGSLVGSNIATLFPENVLGYHTNLCFAPQMSTLIKGTIAGFFPSYFVPKGTEDWFFPFSEKFSEMILETGYMHIQATKPDTIGTALSHNPVGLAAYILEKFSTWTNKEFRKLPDGGLEKKFKLDALLDNVMIYYLTNSITTSQRMYAESFSPREMAYNMDRVQTSVPTACARFKHDIVHGLDWALKDKYTYLIQSTYHHDGGHFAALELPEVLYKDFIEFVDKVDKLSKLLQIHFLHMKFDTPPKGKKVFPLLLLHGWPGSIREFYELMPLLLENEDSKYAFELVVPSLPGYGWSQSAAKPGLGATGMAVIFRNLMLRLGYKKFFIQGGDWGSLVGSNIATLFPENVLGYHSNMCFASQLSTLIKGTIVGFFPSYFVPKGTEDWFFPFSEKFSEMILETGYMHIQATKPDTIGTALSHNPVGLAAYILEKFSTWTNKEFRKLPDGGLEKKFKLDALLDNVMIYYLTNSITTSQRMYAESFSPREMAYNMDRVQTSVPTACARFKHDLVHGLDWALKDKYTNLIQSTYHHDGGHFAALELPEVLYKDFIEFVDKVVKLSKL